MERLVGKISEQCVHDQTVFLVSVGDSDKASISGVHSLSVVGLASIPNSKVSSPLDT